MIADICDLDELDTGNHRAGSYQAVYGWIVKTGISVSTLISGILLVQIGFDAELAVQSAETILRLRVLEATIPALATAAAIAVIARYPLSESRVHEIRAALGKRSGLADEET